MDIGITFGLLGLQVNVCGMQFVGVHCAVRMVKLVDEVGLALYSLGLYVVHSWVTFTILSLYLSVCILLRSRVYIKFELRLPRS